MFCQLRMLIALILASAAQACWRETRPHVAMLRDPDSSEQPRRLAGSLGGRLVLPRRKISAATDAALPRASSAAVSRCLAWDSSPLCTLAHSWGSVRHVADAG